MLKSKICENLGIPNVFDEESNRVFEKGMSEIRKSIKTHNLMTLLIFSGLKIKFTEHLAKDKDFGQDCSLLFSSWNENSRYKPCGHTNKYDILHLINFLKSNEGLLKWIENN